MDSQALNMLALIISFFLFMILTLKIRSRLKKSESSPKIPPGPMKLPIIGNIHNLVASTPHRKLRDLAKIYGPLMHLQLGEVFTVVVSSPEYAKEILKTRDVFPSRTQVLFSDIMCYGSTDIIFAPYGSYWRQLRKICTLELLTQSRVKSFQPIREEKLNNLFKMVDSHEGSPFNLTEAVFSSIFHIISRAAFGKKSKNQEEFISLVKEAIPIAAAFHIGDLFPSAKWFQFVSGLRPKLEKLHVRVDAIFEDIINEHQKQMPKDKEGQGEEAKEDLVDVLLKFHDGNGGNHDICLTTNNIKAIIMDMFSAGGETSSSTITWAMAELIRNPRIMRKAQTEVREAFDLEGRVDEIRIHELKYLKAVVKETLRLHPPIAITTREFDQAFEINGYHIPAKSPIILNIWALGRESSYWTEPDRFHPERFIDSPLDYKGTNFEYLPFGSGRRICPGSTLGLANSELTLAFLLYHFDWNLPKGMKNEDLDMTEQYGISVSLKKDLCVVPTTARPIRKVK